MQGALNGLSPFHQFFATAAVPCPYVPGRAERKLIVELQKRVLEQAYYMPGLWWTRKVVHWSKMRNYVAPPNHYTNQKLQDVWLAED